MEEIIVIEQQVSTKRDKARIAAYCRVSTDQMGQEESFDTQVQYYQNMINQNPRWEFVGIYADKGYSGTNANKRPEFMRLMEDAFAGHIDIIFTKSISRFARNVVDCQTYTQKLKELGVEIRFEREQISNMDPASNFIFSILAAVAQEESHSISQNVRWRYEKDFEKGIYRIGNNRILGFDMNDDGKLEPNEDAWIVQLVFESYANGIGLERISKTLTDKGAKPLRSNKPFSTSTLWRMLRNEQYVGNLLLQKNPPKDYLTKLPQKNVAYKSYYIKNSHQGIVSQELWDAVQKRIADQAKKRAENPYYYGEQQHFLFGVIFCGQCGAPYTRRTLTAYNKKYYKVWSCKERYKGKKGNRCKNSNIREEVILEKVASSLGTKSICKEDLYSKVEKIIISHGLVSVILKRNK